MCHECPNFNAVSETSILYGGGEPVVVESVVKCASRSMCEHIRRYLKNAARGKKESLRRLRERRRRNHPER